MKGLRVSDLVVRRGETEIVRGVSFHLSPGERVALMGPSGAGKTTLLRALAGLEPDWNGELRWEGRSLAEIGPRQWRRSLVLLAQRAAMFPGSVSENVSFAALYHGIESDGAALLRAVDLIEAAERSADDLSEGERQRLALARALAIRPAFLLLDEPTSSLDAARVEMVEVLLEKSEAGLILVTHDETQADRLTSRRISMKQGRMS